MTCALSWPWNHQSPRAQQVPSPCPARALWSAQEKTVLVHSPKSRIYSFGFLPASLSINEGHSISLLDYASWLLSRLNGEGAGVEVDQG